MKIKKKIIILVSVIILLIAAIFALIFISDNFHVEENYENITAIQITNVTSAEKHFTVTTSNEKYSVLNEMGIWYSPDNTNALLEQEYVGEVFSTACSLTAIPLETNSKNFSEYGLDNPSSLFEIEDEKGNKYTLKFGDKVPTGTGYYISLNDENNVYVVSNEQYNMLCGGLNSLRKKNLIAVNSEYFYGITIENKENTITVRPKMTNNVNAHSSSVWEMTSPYLKDVNQHAFETKVVDVLDFTIYDFVDDNPSDYSKYGLDNPKYTIIINGKTTNTVLLGNSFLSEGDTGTKLIYMQIKGLPNVFSIKEEQVAYKDVKPVDLLDSLVFSRMITSVDTIYYTNSGTSHVLKVKEPDYYIDGKNVDENDFKDTYKKIILPVILGEVKDAIGTEICSFTFNFNTDTPSETLVFYEYGELYAAAKVNGKTEFYVKRSSVDDMVESINKLAE